MPTPLGFRLSEKLGFRLSRVAALVAAVSAKATQAVAWMTTDTASENVPPGATLNWQSNSWIAQHSPAGSAIHVGWPGERPTWCYGFLPWFTAQEGTGNTATNTRVRVKQMRFYVLSEATRTWRLFDISDAREITSWTDPFSGIALEATRDGASGGVEFKPDSPKFHHGFGNRLPIVAPADWRAICAQGDFDLVLDDGGGTDDRASARYVVMFGGDYYPAADFVMWSTGYAPGTGSHPYLLATTAEREGITMIPNVDLGCTNAELIANPPPFGAPALATITATPQNILLHTADLSNAVWVPVNATYTSGKLIASAVNDVHLAYQLTDHYGFGTISFEAEVAEYAACSVGANPTAFVHFDLSGAGAVSTLGSGFIAASCTLISAGKYRCVATSGVIDWGSVALFVLNTFQASGATSPAFLGNGTSGVRISKVNFSAGKYDRTYTATTTAQVA